MKKVTIIGFGRFGRTLFQLLKDDFAVTIFKRNKNTDEDESLPEPHQITYDLDEAYKSDAIFFAVPISSFENVIRMHKKYFRKGQTIIDVLSVMTHPKKILKEMINKNEQEILITHPMFGPDSSKSGFKGLPIIVDSFASTENAVMTWPKFFHEKGLHIIEMASEEHDRLAARSQGLTHFIGRILEKMQIDQTPIDSLGTKKLLEVREQVSNDTWELFEDLQHYNPYTKGMRRQLGDAYDTLYNQLIPEQLDKNYLTIGIQGGIGSFNEEAITDYMKQHSGKKYKLVYLHTSENVLHDLQEGDIDQGVCAIHNSVGGSVMETIKALAKYKVAIVEEFAIKISHTLMIRPDAEFSDITTIMTHPQVLAQCKSNLEKKYPHLVKTSGEGELIDHALVAKHLAEKKLTKNIATMGSKRLAEIYNLKIVEDNLQDSAENLTSFLLLKRL